VLDIGSGDGKVTAEISSCIPDGFVVGVDSSEEMISLARTKYPADAFSNLWFQCEDANSLPFDNEFDVVFSNATLHWILDHRFVLRGIYNSLKHGGKVLLQLGGRGNAIDVKIVFDRLIKKEEWHNYFEGFNFVYGFYGTDEYQLWLHQAGLRAKRIELIPKVAAHQGRSGFEAWIRTTWLPHIHQLPEEKRDLFISQWIDEFLKNHPVDKNEIVHVNMMRLEVEAVKL
jgi:trans-aconitate methyltransferase